MPCICRNFDTPVMLARLLGAESYYTISALQAEYHSRPTSLPASSHQLVYVPLRELAFTPAPGRRTTDLFTLCLGRSATVLLAGGWTTTRPLIVGVRSSAALAATIPNIITSTAVQNLHSMFSPL
jgi:hypothetical protein